MRHLTEKEVNKLHGSKVIYKGMIDGPKKVIIYECEKHGLINQRFDVHVKLLKCSKCSKLKEGIFTPEYLRNIISKKKNIYRYIIDNKTYKTKDKLDIICDTHGHFRQTIHNHFYLDNNCPKCSSAKVIELEDSVKNLLKRKSIEIIEYKGYRIKSTLLCITHGKFVSGIENAKIHGCPKCANQSRIEREKIKFINRSKIVWGSIIEFDYKNMEYNGSERKMKIFSSITGLICQLPANHLLGFIPSRSSGETIVENLLFNKEIKYIREMKFDGCKNINKLRFDFYIPEMNTCIEYNGVQHYKPIEFFGGSEKYQYQIKNDEIKRKFCESCGIHLIVISYKDPIIEKLERILC